MKTCAYCGRENAEAATHCVECGTEEFSPAGAPPPKRAGFLEFIALSPNEMDHDWVTLLKCANLGEADAIATHLEGAGITAFIPDSSLVQADPFYLTYGFVRVQVSPKDYHAAREIISTPAAAVEPPSLPPVAS